MKKNIKLFSFVAFFLLLNHIGFSQVAPCSASLHTVFGDVSFDVPVTLNQLGTSPQFGEIKEHNAASAYKHLKGVCLKNQKNCRVEMDNLWRALGYTGFGDPSFTAAQIIPETLPAGKVGWMGAYAKGHKYKWSVLGKDFPAFKIMSKDGSCSLYIMKKCGNAFYDPSVRVKDVCAGVTVPNADCPCDVLRAKGIAVSPEYCPDCKTQTINIAGTGHAESGDMKISTQAMDLIGSYTEGGVTKYLALGSYSVPVRSSYEFTADGKLNYSKTVYVCDRGKGFVPTQNINLPIKLDLTANDNITFGDNGKVYMALNSKQYTALKEVFAATQGSATTTANIASAPAIKSITTTADGSTIGGGSGNNPTCNAQTFNFAASDAADGNSSMNLSTPMTLIAYYDKTGKLAKGETARKYLCLGTYQVPVNSNIKYSLKGQSSLAKVIEVCDKGNGVSDTNINIPVSLTSKITKQDVNIGDGGRVYLKLTESQFAKLGKTYSRCCSDGSSNCYNK